MARELMPGTPAFMRKRIKELEAALAGIEVKLARDQDVDGAMRIVLSVKRQS